MGLDINGLSAFRPARDKAIAGALKDAERHAERDGRKKAKESADFLEDMADEWERAKRPEQDQ